MRLCLAGRETTQQARARLDRCQWRATKTSASAVGVTPLPTRVLTFAEFTNVTGGRQGRRHVLLRSRNGHSARGRRVRWAAIVWYGIAVEGSRVIYPNRWGRAGRGHGHDVGDVGRPGACHRAAECVPVACLSCQMHRAWQAGTILCSAGGQDSRVGKQDGLRGDHSTCRHSGGEAEADRVQPVARVIGANTCSHNRRQREPGAARCSPEGQLCSEQALLRAGCWGAGSYRQPYVRGGGKSRNPLKEANGVELSLCSALRRRPASPC